VFSRRSEPEIFKYCLDETCLQCHVNPCHHGMTHSQVARMKETAHTHMDDSCEYIKKNKSHSSRQETILQL